MREISCIEAKNLKIKAAA